MIAVTTLHITNGDCAGDMLKQFITDPVMITADVLHDGPAPLVDLETWHEVRARFLAGSFDAWFEETRDDLARMDRDIADAERYKEIVLWFEHDLFDQLLLIRALDLLASKPNVSLICIDRFPGVARFVGLGQLTAEQLASLVDTRRPVTHDQYAIAAKAWNAFRAPDPTALVELVRLKSDALPFLRDALKRFLEEYPWTTNGLSRTANTALSELDAGPRSGLDLFVATQARE